MADFLGAREQEQVLETRGHHPGPFRRDDHKPIGLSHFVPAGLPESGELAVSLPDAFIPER